MYDHLLIVTCRHAINHIIVFLIIYFKYTLYTIIITVATCYFHLFMVSCLHTIFLQTIVFYSIIFCDVLLYMHMLCLITCTNAILILVSWEKSYTTYTVHFVAKLSLLWHTGTCRFGLSSVLIKGFWESQKSRCSITTVRLEKVTISFKQSNIILMQSQTLIEATQV